MPEQGALGPVSISVSCELEKDSRQTPTTAGMDRCWMFNHHLDAISNFPGEEVEMRDCLDQAELGATLWGVVLILLIDTGRPSPLQLVPFPECGSQVE